MAVFCQIPETTTAMETAGRFFNWPVAAGETQILHNIPARSSIDVAPGAGGTMNVQTRVSPGGPLVSWTAGDTATATQDMLEGPVYELIFSATTADGIAGIYYGERP